ncbi:MAG: hypothetical protein JSW40_04150 [Candidatus Omnitrophota bacterium]|nr:MAG: hypothetical protein JSW40_04150 [Candidatus Omnitrophota bacterium]
MVYFIFTVDGDWKEYFNIHLSEKKRLPQLQTVQTLIEQEIKVAQRLLEGKFLHFIHTSSRARTFFIQKSFLALWKYIIQNSGDIGLHCHEDDPHKAYYIQDIARMRKVISEQVNILRSYGLNIQAYRGGNLAFCKGLIPILEENGIRFDFSCEPGRYFVDADSVVSDWRAAPTSLYRMSHLDHRREGNSKVYEVPIGTSQGHFLYFEKSSLQEISKVAHNLGGHSSQGSCDIIVSVLTHTYEYDSQDAIKIIGEKISLLKEYGRFINLKELEEIVEIAP